MFRSRRRTIRSAATAVALVLLAQAPGPAVAAEQPPLLRVDPAGGTIIVSGGRSGTAAGSGDATIRVIEEAVVSQPPPFTKGRTVVVPRTRIIIDDERGRTWAPLRQGESAGSLAEKLNQMGLSRAELLETLEKLQRAGIYRGGVLVE